MASLPSSTTTSPLTPQAHQEDGKDGAPSLRTDYDDLISKLPLEVGWAPFRLRHYQGFLFPQDHLPGILAIQRHLNPRPDDLFLISYPKSGTTWSKALTFATRTRTQHPLARHPLLSLNPHQCVLHMEMFFGVGQASRLEALPSPRIMSTHMPYSLLPDSVTRSDCRIVYVARDPKDVLVSFWHFSKHRTQGAEPLTFAKSFELFCEGKSSFGPVWDHVLQYWRESLRRPEKVLFLKYEGMLEDPVGNVKRLAEFMGCPFSPEEEREGVVEEIIRLCSFEKLSRLDINSPGSTATVGPSMVLSTSTFFRKGVAGDWRNHLSPEMARKLDGIMEEKLRGSGLSFGRMGSEEAATVDDPLGIPSGPQPECVVSAAPDQGV